MTPDIFPRSRSGIDLTVEGTYKWGHQPENPWAVTFHHSAGPRARNYNQACQLHRSYQLQHIRQGFGDIGYHAAMDDLGRFYLLRPLDAVGAHVGGANTGNLGIMLHGNYEYDQLLPAQIDSMRWLFRGGFAELLKVTEADIKIIRGHREWPDHRTNACPGDNLMRHIAYRRNNETW